MPESAARGMLALPRLAYGSVRHRQGCQASRRTIAHGAGRVRWSAPPGDMTAGRLPLVQVCCPWPADMSMPQADSQQAGVGAADILAASINGIAVFLQPAGGIQQTRRRP